MNCSFQFLYMVIANLLGIHGNNRVARVTIGILVISATSWFFHFIKQNIFSNVCHSMQSCVSAYLSPFCLIFHNL